MMRLTCGLLLLLCLFPAPSPSQITFERTYGGSGDDVGYAVQQTRDLGYVIAGSTDSFGASYKDVYIIKTDSSGDIQWTRIYGGSGSDEAHSVMETHDGGYVITGWTSSFDAYGFDVYLLRTDSSGDTLWTRTYGGIGWSDWDGGNCVQETQGGGYIVAGITLSIGENSYDVYLIRTDSVGNILWTNTFGGVSFQDGYAVQETQDGGYIIVGLTDSYGSGQTDIYLIKTDGEGVTSIEGTHRTSSLPKTLNLAQNFPNPFNPMTTIAFDIPDAPREAHRVSLAVYDLRGRLVRRLVDSDLMPGSHRVAWDGKDEAGRKVSSGIYLYTLKAGVVSLTRKMVAVK